MTRAKLSALMPKNWVLKLFALIIGAGLWYFVVGEDQIDITINVPIEVHNLPANLVIANKFKKDIEVSIRGSRRVIQEIRQQNISRPVDLSKVEAGAIVIANDRNSIPFPQGITVQRLQPSSFTLLVDQLEQKDFAINPVLEGEPAAGYVLKSITIDPDRLPVTGPKTLLEKQTALKTVVIVLDGLEQSTKLQVALDLSDEMFKLIGETVVTATLEVDETMLIKTVRGIPVNVRDAELPFRTIPSMVTVEANIPENLIRDTPELAMLFRASVSSKTEPDIDGFIPLTVNGINVPGHKPIAIMQVKPKKVRLIPVENSSVPESQPQL
ncbi:YbbR-like domain-containing protein [Desulfogranum marinum]|uniref:CdaR family protein n=1 Tax=Desulfogranum marinum TaxID=453220 RepID=UPI0019640B19|nr:CdaR family protein [Desulfogranum marinum]MBM9512746.1 YbbR-like domain-containing protein [Desulfogranum marinum]